MNRFTPTGVGTTRIVLLVSILVSVHPHGRGDNPSCANNPTQQPGSPPRAWGQRRANCADRPDIGSPPRAWGQRIPDMEKALETGSPPRAWGQRPLAVRV